MLGYVQSSKQRESGSGKARWGGGGQSGSEAERGRVGKRGSEGLRNEGASECSLRIEGTSKESEERSGQGPPLGCLRSRVRTRAHPRRATRAFALCRFGGSNGLYELGAGGVGCWAYSTLWGSASGSVVTAGTILNQKMSLMPRSLRPTETISMTES
jgi:hypothetical protein